MRYIRNLIVIPAIAVSIFICHISPAFAEGSVSMNESTEDAVSENEAPQQTASQNSVSDNAAPEITVSDNTVSQNLVSDGTISENTAPPQSDPDKTVSEDIIPVKVVSSIKISLDRIVRKERGAEIRIDVKSTGSKIIRVEAENSKVRIRKRLYRASDIPDRSSLILSLYVTVNGRYTFIACDSEGNTDSFDVPVDELDKRSITGYREMAKDNSGQQRLNGQGKPSAIYGDRRGAGIRKPYGGKNYSVKSVNSAEMKKNNDQDRYGKWSLLKKKENKNDEKVWYEPPADEDDVLTEDPVASSDSSDDLPGLSDYGIKLFKTDVLGIRNGTGASSETAVPAKKSTGGLKSLLRDDNIDDMDNNNSVVIIGIVVFIIILLMLIAAFMLLRSHSGVRKKKKIKTKIKTKKRSAAASARSGAVSSKVPVASISPAAGKNVQAKKAEKAVKTSKPVPLKGTGDEGIEKYARMTEDYVRSKFNIELKRVDLKKYYSERHGFDCVDFTYQPASGVIPAQFRTHLNDVDTALSNVSGVDTITFAVDNTTGTYRTTFYLGK